MVFNFYRTGMSVPAIVDQLNMAGVPAPRGGKWTPMTVQNMLRNERYAGDTVLQKYICLSHITHKCVPNDATEVPSYYVRNSHIPIVDRRTFDQVQRIMELKAPHGESSRYPYEDSKIICPFCGEKLVTRLVHCNGKRKTLGCFGEQGCHGFAVKTWMVDAVLLAAFEELDEVHGTGDGSKRIRELKGKGTPETVEYAFLADAVKRITFIPHPGTRMQNHKKGPATEEKTCDWDVVIDWRCGLTSTLPLPIDERYSEEPMHVAEMYDRYLERIKTGDYIPTRPKNQRERKMKEAQRIVKRINPVPSPSPAST